MKNIFYLSVLIVITTIYFSGCEFGVPTEDITTVLPDAVISGQIVESVTGDPIFNASVKITDGVSQVTTTTGNDGKFSISFSLTEDKELTIIYFKSSSEIDTTGGQRRNIFRAGSFCLFIFTISPECGCKRKRS